jgi:hypothetical protein
MRFTMHNTLKLLLKHKKKHLICIFIKKLETFLNSQENKRPAWRQQSQLEQQGFGDFTRFIGEKYGNNQKMSSKDLIERTQ